MSDTALTQKQHRTETLFFLGFVIVLSFLTYFYRYWEPKAPFWDENYYITDAQREMNDVFYMQIHPPLGKLLIAWGEELIQANPTADQFLTTEHADNFPKDFSFTGYRFFPALLAWLGAPLLFLIFLLITRNGLMSTLLSFLYIFDNALLVHNRGAMLDGPMMFFLVLTLLAFFLTLRYRDTRWKLILCSALFGASFALGLTTKLQNAIMILLVPFLFWSFLPDPRKIWDFCWSSFLAFIILFVGVWQIHFSHMVKINPVLKNQGYYLASDAYKDIVARGKQGSLLSFPVMMRDSLAYVGDYNKGIPKLDLCKPDENGSPFFLWPIGATSINYRWETPDGKAYRYLFLQSNPVGWFAAFAAVLLSGAYFAGTLFFPQKKTRFAGDRRLQIGAVLLLYCAYMATMATMDRVLFLYSYFPPLLFGFILCGLMTMELQQIGGFVFNEKRRTFALLALALSLFLSFQFFRPLTYYEPLTDAQFQRRSLLPMWQLRCVNCGKESPLVKHRCEA